MKKKSGEKKKEALEVFKALNSQLDRDGGGEMKQKIRQLQRSYSTIQTLLAVSASINSTLNLEELLRKIVDAVVEITDCKRGFLMLRENGELSFAIARSRSREELPPEEFEISRSVVEKVAETGQPAYLANIQEAENFKDKRSIIDLNLKTAICIPLKFEEKLVGVIYADSDRVTASFGPDDLSILNAFGAQAAVAIENAKRHGELELTKRSLEDQNVALKRELAGRFQFSGMVGRSEAMRSIFDIVRKVAPLNTTVLIQGETGTGKELIAKAIHYNGPRRDRPMLSVNCGALPRDLLESELFGYKRGAFTGAEQDKVGIFEAAAGGTILLDEVGEMPPELQVKLLRVLQEGEILRLGDEKPRKVDVRVISATNKDLAREVERGTFRSDLYYRLNVVPINIPPLRERPEDILPLADFFLEKYSLAMGIDKPRLTRGAREILLTHPWYGNVRELEHTIERALALSEGADTLGPERLQHMVKEESELKFPPGGDTSLKSMLSFWERELIQKMLVKNDWNVSKTAAALKISRQQLHQKIKKFGLSPGV